MHEIVELRLNASFVARKRNLFRACKGRRLVPAGALALAALVLASRATALRAQSQIPSGKDVVTPSVYVSHDHRDARRAAAPCRIKRHINTRRYDVLDPAGRGSTARIAER